MRHCVWCVHACIRVCAFVLLCLCTQPMCMHACKFVLVHVRMHVHVREQKTILTLTQPFLHYDFFSHNSASRSDSVTIETASKKHSVSSICSGFVAFVILYCAGFIFGQWLSRADRIQIFMKSVKVTNHFLRLTSLF